MPHPSSIAIPQLQMLAPPMGDANRYQLTRFQSASTASLLTVGEHIGLLGPINRLLGALFAIILEIICADLELETGKVNFSETQLAERNNYRPIRF